MANERSLKDKAMAARLKKEGVTRTVGNCPICHNSISLRLLPTHVMKCKGRRKL